MSCSRSWPSTKRFTAVPPDFHPGSEYQIRRFHTAWTLTGHPPVFSRKIESSVLGHPRKPQALDKGSLEQRADLRHPVIPSGIQARDAGKAILAAQPAGFGEFGSGAFGLTV